MARPHKKVKSGCRTCKVRKVKCDEGRPSCVRCLAARRVCEGYGVWGGGPNGETGTKSTAHEPLPGSAVRPLQPSRPPQIKLKHEEVEWRDWFQSITIIKLQGPFKTPFWESEVLCASFCELAVFHAMIALGSLHKRISMGIRDQGPGGEPDRMEQFTLRQYNRAIQHLLQPHFTTRDKSTVRTALIACMIFVCLEFLRGRFKTGHHHLLCGLNLLPVLMQYAGSNRSPADDGLIYVFTRVNMAAVQIGHGILKPTSHFKPIPMPLPLLFQNVTQAREILDRLTNDILYLEVHRRDGAEGERERIKRELAAWHTVYNASGPVLQLALGPSPAAALGYQTLLMRYPMVRIMADTCLREAGDEKVFDAYTADFVHMMTLATRFVLSVRGVHNSNDPVYKNVATELVHFTADLGWSPQLFYTALHCRVRSVRWRALRLLRAYHCREGIWDSYLMASAAEEVMRMEEGVCSLQRFVEDHGLFLFEFSSTAQRECEPNVVVRDQLLPLPPANRRISDVRILLPDEVVFPSMATFTCKRKTEGGLEEITREFPLVSGPV